MRVHMQQFNLQLQRIKPEVQINSVDNFLSIHFGRTKLIIHRICFSEAWWSENHWNYQEKRKLEFRAFLFILLTYCRMSSFSSLSFSGPKRIFNFNWKFSLILFWELQFEHAQCWFLCVQQWASVFISVFMPSFLLISKQMLRIGAWLLLLFTRMIQWAHKTITNNLSWKLHRP